MLSTANTPATQERSPVAISTAAKTVERAITANPCQAIYLNQNWRIALRMIGLVYVTVA